MSKTLNIRQLDSRSGTFDSELRTVLAFDSSTDQSIHDRVIEILGRVKKEGDAALLDYTRQFDRFPF